MTLYTAYNITVVLTDCDVEHGEFHGGVRWC